MAEQPQTLTEEPDEFIGVGPTIVYAIFLVAMVVIEYHFVVIPWLDQLQALQLLRP